MTDNLKSLMEQARSILTIASNESPDGFRIDKAAQLAVDMTKVGEREMIELIQLDAQLTRRETFSPVIVELNKVLSLETIQHQLDLIEPLAKAQRVFTELVALQCMQNQKDHFSLSSKTRQGINNSIDDLLAVLPEQEAIKARFDLQTTQQAVRQLFPDEEQWVKSLDKLKKMGIAIICNNPLKALEVVIEAHDDIRRSLDGRWYKDVYRLNWDSMQLTTFEQFDELIRPRIKDCLKEEKKSICLANVLIHLISSDKVEDQVRHCSFHGKDETPGLARLVSMRKWQSSNIGGKRGKEVIVAADNLRKVRFLSMRYLQSITHSEESHMANYREPSVRVLKERIDKLTEQSKKDVKSREKYSEEERQLKAIFREKKEQLEKANEDILMERGEIASDIVTKDRDRQRLGEANLMHVVITRQVDEAKEQAGDIKEARVEMAKEKQALEDYYYMEDSAFEEVVREADSLELEELKAIIQ